MHILLALLGTVVTILVLLYRLADIGVDLGGLNPFSGRRRRAWRQQFDANPIFALEDPREIAAVLVTGVAKIDGDLSAEEKRALLDEFTGTFSLPSAKASELLNSTVFLLGDMQVMSGQLGELLPRFRERLDAAQVESMLEMVERIATVDGGATEQQLHMITAIRRAFVPAEDRDSTWG